MEGIYAYHEQFGHEKALAEERARQKIIDTRKIRAMRDAGIPVSTIASVKGKEAREIEAILSAKQ